MKSQLIDDKKIQEQTGNKKNNICEDVGETQWDEESTKSKNSKRFAEKKNDRFLLFKTIACLETLHFKLMSSNFCPHLIFKFGDLIEFSVLKDWFN